MKATTILIVEDETVIAMDLEQQLELLGYEIVGVAASGADATLLAQSEAPDLVLIDIRLRGQMDGIEVAKQLSLLCIPFLFLTSHTDEDTIRRAKQTEPFGYLVKPFVVRELHSAIQVALYRSESSRRLREQEVWLRTTLQSIGDAVLAIDPEGRVKFMNPKAEEFSGWDEQRAFGHSVEEVIELENGDCEPFANPLTKAIAEGKLVRLPEGIHLRKQNGGRIEIEDAATPIRNDRGRIIGGVIVFRDVTAKRQVERERAAALHELKQVNYDLDQFASATSHDLKEPLRNIVASLQFLSRRFGSQLDDAATPFLQHAVQGALQMSALIDDLLAYSRATPGSTDLVLVCESREALQAALDNLQTSLRETGTIVCAGDLPRLPIGLPQLSSVLQNLIANSVKYRRRDVAPMVNISAERLGTSWQFSVTDNGIGFPAESSERIFGLFKRLHTHEYAGTGVGLAICKRIVERYGGRIWACSTPGEGSTFYFTLPAVASLAMKTAG